MTYKPTDLNAVYRWAAENNMEFNSDKFEYYSIANEEIDRVYKADDGTCIERQSSLRDLGVKMSDTASFSEYIKEKVEK